MHKDQSQLSNRNSSIELLRILTMIMIVSCHFATHGKFSFDEKTISIPLLWWNIIEMGGNLGVDVFVIISGYFLVTSSRDFVKLDHILKFWGQVFFYSVSIYLLSCVFKVANFDLATCIKTLFPITFGSWWFASTYFVLYLVHPFLNMLLQKLDKKTYQKLIVTQLMLWCIIPTFTSSNYESNSLIWFITLYSVAGYIRLFGLNPQFTSKHYFVFWILFSGLRYFSSIILLMIGTKIPFASKYSLYFYEQQSVLTFLSALSLFLVFEKWELKYTKWINTLASATFGVYLIHENSIIRHLLWIEVFKNAQYQDSTFLIPYSIIVTAVVYVGCTIIDLLRQRLIEKPFMNYINHQFIKNSLFVTAGNAVRDLIFGKEN